MSEKYIDLAPTISRDWGYMSSEARSALSWLDDHPDQVPGRTITESEFDRIANEAFDKPFNFHSKLIVAARLLGVRVVPDPEPTNAEKLKAVLDAIGDSTDGYREHLASKLDEAGVKAPGGDDD